MYGEEDYDLGLEIGLPVVQMLNPQGHFNEFAPELIRGMYL
jgi:isoleucyl-tRNA synthetase